MMMDYTNTIYQKDIDIALEQVKNMKKLSGKTLLITGATGLIGSFIIDMLVKWNSTVSIGKRIKIQACGRNINRLQERFSYCTDETGLLFQEYDVNEEIMFSEPVDYIIHAASNAYPAAFLKDPVGTMMNNIFGTYQLLQYGRNYGMSRFLFVSSGEVYGEGKETNAPYVEEFCGYVNLLDPRSCYPMSKRAAETMCVSFSNQYHQDIVIVRPSHVYGPNVTTNDNRATVQFTQNVISGNDIVMKSAGNQERSYTYIADAASAILYVLLNGENGQAYNVANCQSVVTIAEFAGIMADLGGVAVVYVEPGDEALKQRTPIERAVLDAGKLEKLGWHGCYSIEKGIGNMLSILKG